MKIEVSGLTKQYKDKKALNNISFSLTEPIIYGLLGRNGAGKTTFMEILSGHILETAGAITVNGESAFDNRSITKKVCLIKEGNNFNKEMRIKDILKLYALFYPKWDQDLANNLVDEYNLSGKMKVKSLSKGMESALGIIVGLASKAPITIFDEPYIGLDAAARKKFYEVLLEEYESEKRMIIFSTHLIDEVSQLFEEVLILQDGNLILQEKSEELRDKFYAVSGKKTVVEQFIINKQIIKKESLAGTMKAYLYGEKTADIPNGLSFEGVAIQDLMIYLTEGKGGVK